MSLISLVRGLAVGVVVGTTVLFGSPAVHAGTARVPAELKYVTGESPVPGAGTSSEESTPKAAPSSSQASSTSGAAASSGASGTAGTSSAAAAPVPETGGTSASAPGPTTAEKTPGKADSHYEGSKAPKYIMLALVSLALVVVALYLKNRDDDD